MPPRGMGGNRPENGARWSWALGACSDSGVYTGQEGWKIVNYYYNSGKAFIPGKNAEKLEVILNQEKEKQKFIKVVL